MLEFTFANTFVDAILRLLAKLKTKLSIISFKCIWFKCQSSKHEKCLEK